MGEAVPTLAEIDQCLSVLNRLAALKNAQAEGGRSMADRARDSHTSKLYNDAARKAERKASDLLEMAATIRREHSPPTASGDSHSEGEGP